MKSTARLTCVPTTGARPRDQKADVFPPASHAYGAVEEAARDFCVDILVAVLEGWAAVAKACAHMEDKGRAAGRQKRANPQCEESGHNSAAHNQQRELPEERC